jgi:aldose 1-epimerase
MRTRFFTFSAVVVALTACQAADDKAESANSVTEANYGKMPDGREVSIYTLTNENGMVAKVTEYGAILVSLEVPDKDGKVADITHGYDSLEGWLTNTSYFGSTVGRYGNRIAEGEFSLNDEEYTLAKNNEPNGNPVHLHGGIKGFDKVLWSGEIVDEDGASGVSFTYVSEDGEEGYPGELTAVVTYTLSDDNELTWKAEATVEGKSTPVNIVHHSYWNLSNDQMSSINDHKLMIDAEKYLPTNAALIPTGKMKPVAGTPFDFTEPTKIGKRVDADDEDLELGGGYDHCWVLTEEGGIRLAATLEDPKTGRKLELSTNQPGLQFYGGNFLDGTVAGKDGQEYPKRSALCLETQKFPDSPNQPEFPSAILKPGETYSHTMVHKFSW